MFSLSPSARISTAMVVAAGFLAAAIWAGSSAPSEEVKFQGKTSFDTVSVRTLRVVDEQGRPRLVIASPLPNPVVNGKELPRSSLVTGIQFLDAAGNEHGGVAIIDRVEGAALCFDYDTAEAMCMTKARGYKGISIFDPPGKDAKVGMTGSERMELSVNDGQSRVALSDSQGKERIVLAIDDKDNPHVEVLDANGKAVYEVPEK